MIDKIIAKKSAYKSLLEVTSIDLALDLYKNLSKGIYTMAYTGNNA